MNMYYNLSMGVGLLLTVSHVYYLEYYEPYMKENFIKMETKGSHKYDYVIWRKGSEIRVNRLRTPIG